MLVLAVGVVVWGGGGTIGSTLVGGAAATLGTASSSSGGSGSESTSSGPSATARTRTVKRRSMVAWEEAPDVVFPAQIPAWAGCEQPPCQYTEMVNGQVDLTVRQAASQPLCNCWVAAARLLGSYCVLLGRLLRGSGWPYHVMHA